MKSLLSMNKRKETEISILICSFFKNMKDWKDIKRR